MPPDDVLRAPALDADTPAINRLRRQQRSVAVRLERLIAKERRALLVHDVEHAGLVLIAQLREQPVQALLRDVEHQHALAFHAAARIQSPEERQHPHCPVLAALHRAQLRPGVVPGRRVPVELHPVRIGVIAHVSDRVVAAQKVMPAHVKVDVERIDVQVGDERGVDHIHNRAERLILLRRYAAFRAAHHAAQLARDRRTGRKVQVEALHLVRHRANGVAPALHARRVIPIDLMVQTAHGHPPGDEREAQHGDENRQDQPRIGAQKKAVFERSRVHRLTSPFIVRYSRGVMP